MTSAASTELPSGLRPRIATEPVDSATEGVGTVAVALEATDAATGVGVGLLPCVTGISLRVGVRLLRCTKPGLARKEVGMQLGGEVRIRGIGCVHGGGGTGVATPVADGSGSVGVAVPDTAACDDMPMVPIPVSAGDTLRIEDSAMPRIVATGDTPLFLGRGDMLRAMGNEETTRGTWSS